MSQSTIRSDDVTPRVIMWSSQKKVTGLVKSKIIVAVYIWRMDKRRVEYGATIYTQTDNIDDKFNVSELEQRARERLEKSPIHVLIPSPNDDDDDDNNRGRRVQRISNYGNIESMIRRLVFWKDVGCYDKMQDNKKSLYCPSVDIDRHTQRVTLKNVRITARQDDLSKKITKSQSDKIAKLTATIASLVEKNKRMAKELKECKKKQHSLFGNN